QYLTDNSYPEMIYTFNSTLKKIPIEQHKTLRKLFFLNLSKSAISTSRDYFQMKEYCIGLTFAKWAIRLNPSILSCINYLKLFIILNKLRFLHN
ncbi:MAG: hypothetical protein NT116_05475, partial [Candidatus Parcubacteria bacterium]|nr:hypothetical protein [Candidatus Parcubacteria bacterium]